jgi:hypothetical protein
LIVSENLSLNSFSMSSCICVLRLCRFMRDVMKDVLQTTSRRFVNVDMIDTRSQ